MTPRWRPLSLLLILVALATLPVHAQILIPREDNWEVAVFFGLANIRDRQLITPAADGSTPRSVGLDYGGGVQAGFRVGENLGKWVTAEVEYSFANAPLTFRNLTPSLPALKVDHYVHSILYGVTVSPMERTAQIRPYGAFSAGAAYYQISSDSEGSALLSGVDLRDRWQFAYAFGGGVKFRAGDQAGFRVDVRDHVTGVPGYGLPTTSPVDEEGNIGAGLRTDGSLHNWQVNFGFFYTWGKR